MNRRGYRYTVRERKPHTKSQTRTVWSVLSRHVTFEEADAERKRLAFACGVSNRYAVFLGRNSCHGPEAEARARAEGV